MRNKKTITTHRVDKLCLSYVSSLCYHCCCLRVIPLPLFLIETYYSCLGFRRVGGAFWQTWSTGEWNGKPLQYSHVENLINSMKRQKDRTLKGELLRSVGAQYATGNQWRNNSRKNKEMDPKQKQHLVVDVSGDGSKVWCCKEQYWIGNWNGSMNQGKLELVK